MTAVTQPWTHDLTMMQQSVLLTAVRGPDALPKYHPAKFLLRWYRRCILLSAMDGRILDDPVEENGGSFTGPCVNRITEYNPSPTAKPEHRERVVWAAVGDLRDRSTWAADPHYSMGQPHPRGRDTYWLALDDWVDTYIRALDEVPHHYQLHFMHAVEILGYKHPVLTTRYWWHQLYLRLAADMHLTPEGEEQLDYRLGDSREQWLDVADRATRT